MTTPGHTLIDLPIQVYIKGIWIIIFISSAKLFIKMGLLHASVLIVGSLIYDCCASGSRPNTEFSWEQQSIGNHSITEEIPMRSRNRCAVFCAERFHCHGFSFSGSTCWTYREEDPCGLRCDDDDDDTIPYTENMGLFYKKQRKGKHAIVFVAGNTCSLFSQLCQ